MPSAPPLTTPPAKVPSIILWVNSTLNRLTSSFGATSSDVNVILKQGDTIGIEVHILSSDQDGQVVEYPMPVSGGLTLAIGRVDTAPLSGDFQFAYNTETTSLLPFNATASQLQTALNSLPSIAAIGGVVVIKNGTICRISWNTKCVVPYELIVHRNTLYPSSSISINEVVEGSLTESQIIQTHIKQTPIANITSFEDQDASVATLQVIKPASFSGDTKIWRVAIRIRPQGGSFVISFYIGSIRYTTNAISIESSALEVQNELYLKYNATWSVSKNASYSWDISTSNVSALNLSVDSSSIISYTSKYGILNLNTIQVEELLSGNASAVAKLEIELEYNGTKQTLYQGDCTILNDLIDSDVYTVAQWGDYIPADSVVRYDVSQSLTTLQKAQARANIDAIDESEILSLQNKDIELEERIVDIELSTLNADKVASLNANSTLTGLNPVISNSQLTSTLGGYALQSHGHTVSDIIGLRNELDDKSQITHSHPYQNIVGLGGQLALKLDALTAITLYSSIGHTHNAFTNLALDSLTVFGNITTDELNCSTTITANGLVANSLTINGPDSQSLITGNLTLFSNNNQDDRGVLICRNIEAQNYIKCYRLEANEFYNPASGITFSLTDGIKLTNIANVGTPAPVYNQFIEVEFGTGEKFKIPAISLPY